LLSDTLEKIGEHKVKCPLCGKNTLIISYYTYEAPLIGKILIETGKCINCGFRWSDVSIAESQGPKTLTFKVNGRKELNALVVKASSATIKIPELGVEVKPGPAAPGYITTIEGIIQRILDHVPSECFTTSSECHEKVKILEKAMKGDIKFTLILEDPLGKSTIIKEEIQHNHNTEEKNSSNQP
jgi:zinc finger protein